MGISHPLSDEYDALRGAVLSTESTPPPSSCCATDDDYLEHPVCRMDTLAGLAIKYGVEISDIKKANSLVSDSQMFAHKTLLIPLPGRPIPSSVKLHRSGQRMKIARAPSHRQNRDTSGPLDSPKSGLQGTSFAMGSLQRYYGLTSHKGNTTDRSFQNMASERLLNSCAAPGTGSTDRSWDCDDPENVFSAPNSATAAKSNGASQQNRDGSMRRRQKVEADRMSNTADDFLADPTKAIKSLLPRPVSSIRLNMDESSTDSSQKSSISFLDGFRSPSAPNFADADLYVVRFNVDLQPRVLHSAIT